MPNERIYRFVNNNRLIDTVDAFLQNQRSPVFSYFKTAEDFLNEKDEADKTNFQRIQDSIVNSDVYNNNLKLYNKRKFGEIYLPYSVELVASQSKIQIQNLAFQGAAIVRQPEAWFKADKLVELENNKEYIRSTNQNVNNTVEGKLVQLLTQCSVWVWSRALNRPTKLVDVSPYIISCSSSNTGNGGNFQLKLAPVTYSVDENKEVQVNRDSVITFFENVVSRTHIIDVDEKNNYVTSRFLFKDLFQQNDLVFIRFEKLELEKDRKAGFENMLVDSSELPDQVFDMIALIDNCAESINPDDGNVSVDITGRDLIKIFIEDGTYFFPFEVSKGSEYIASGGKDNALTNRMFFNGGISSLQFAQGEPSIVDIFQFVISQLSNITICPDELFSFYQDSGIGKFLFSIPDKKDMQDEGVRNRDYRAKQLEKGIWKLFNIVTDQYIDQRKIVDSSLSSATGSLLNFLQSVCQPELVEFYSDTYGNSFYFIIRKPPFDRKSYESLLNGLVRTKVELKDKNQTNFELKSNLIIDVDATMVISESISDEEQVYSWYHLTPRQNIYGAAYNMVYIPPVFLPEYAEIFGAKPYQVQHNYIPYSTKITSDSGLIIKSIEEQSLLDLKFLIESTCYLPFTRKGRITIIGDRRIKRGNFIRYVPTSEIFYVDAVTQNTAINDEKLTRATTILVSRGMVEKHIIDDKYSYFNILKLDRDITYIKSKQEVKKTRSVIVNQSEIDAFYKKDMIAQSQKKFIDNYFESSFENFIGKKTIWDYIRSGRNDEENKQGVESSAQGLMTLINKWEKNSISNNFHPVAYPDGIDKNGNQKYTIGWGHQIKSTEKYLLGKTIDQTIADKLREDDIKVFSDITNKQCKLLGIKLNQQQFDAVTDFAYTTGSLRGYPGLMLKIKQYLNKEISDKALIARWTNTALTRMGNPTKLPGLIARRKDEVAMFLGKGLDYIQEAQDATPQPIYEEQEYVAGYEEVSEVNRNDFWQNFVVNEEVFKFFISRKQFIK